MSSLENKKISESYKDLLQVSNSNSGVDATLRTVEDGEGTSAGVQLSTTDTSFNGNYILKEQGRQNHVANTMSSPYYRFDGTSDYISLGTDAKLDITKTITLSSWIRGHSSGGDTSFFIICRDDDATHQQYFINFSMSALSFRIFDGGSAQTVSYSVDLRDDKWHHVAGTYDGSNLKLYLDGVEVATQAYSGNIDSEGTNEPVFIGQRGDNARRFYGDIAQAQIFNLALSATEIKNLYSGESLPYKYKGANNTNIINNVEHSDWADGNTSHTDNQSDADGGTDAVLIAPSSATDNYFYDSALSVTKGKNYKFSVQLKSASGTPTIDIILRDNGTSNKTSQSCTLSTSWQTFEVERVAGASSLDVFIGGYNSWTSSEGNIYAYKPEVSISGCVAEFDGTGIASDKWLDKSGNDLHGTVSGATVENAPSGDDGLVYEEGTWDPIVAEYGDITKAMLKLNSSVGSYVRVGNMVTVSAFINIGDPASGGADPNGDARNGVSYPMGIHGLPYTSENVGTRPALCFGEQYYLALASGSFLGGWVLESSTKIYLLEATNANYSSVLRDEISNNAFFSFTATYKI